MKLIKLNYPINMIIMMMKTNCWKDMPMIILMNPKKICKKTNQIKNKRLRTTNKFNQKTIKMINRIFQTLVIYKCHIWTRLQNPHYPLSRFAGPNKFRGPKGFPGPIKLTLAKF